jgi:hypothetical protein
MGVSTIEYLPLVSMTLMGITWTPGEWGVGYRAACIRLVTVHVLDDLGDRIYARGFGDSFHEGIVPLMILITKSHCLLHALFNVFKHYQLYSEYHLE